MKVYFAGADRPNTLEKAWQGGARNILLSYIELRKNFTLRKHLDKYNFNIILDSGAYSAYTLGKEIAKEEYAEFLKAYPRYFEYYFNLDVIGDFQATWDNQDYFENEGLKPIPVYHYGEPSEVLRMMVRQYKHIGIGGMVPISTQQLDKWLEHIFFNKYGELKYTDTKFHGLGLTTYSLLKKYPFASCDSTLWLIAKKFKHTLNEQGKQIRSETASLKDTISWHLKLEERLKNREYTARQRLF